MKFEKLNENNGKVSRVFLYGLITGVALLIVSNLFLTKAKYKVVDSAKLVNSTISYSNADLNVIAMYKSNGKTEELLKEVPKGYYDIDNEKSYCIVGNNKEDRITNNMEYTGSSVKIDITKKGTKCYVYFIPVAAKTLANVGIKDNIEKGKTEFTGIATESDSGLFSGEDDYGTTYYYRGIVNNNWIQLGNTYWRIIRINGNGTIRLIYSGTDSPKTTGSETTINDGAIVKFNEQNDDNKYVGFMYGGSTKEASSTSYEEAHENKYKSTILESIEKWYKDSKLDNYSDLLDGSTGFCGDRSIAKENETWWTNDTKKGYGKEKTAYGAFNRFITIQNSWKAKQTPTLKCNNSSNDLYTTSIEQGKGNGALTYPIGLITADEVIYAGGFGGKENRDFYLYNEKNYWTMTPIAMSPFYTIGSDAGIYYIRSTGFVDYCYISYNIVSARPVINLKADTPFTNDRDGSKDKPFTVKLD